MPKLTIDGNEVEVPAGSTILQACEHAGIEVSHFCYHERLAIAGNCRMCLVEVEKSPKPIASCAMPATDGMVVHTKSPKAIKAQKGVMEFLLINTRPWPMVSTAAGSRRTSAPSATRISARWSRPT